MKEMPFIPPLKGNLILYYFLNHLISHQWNLCYDHHRRKPPPEPGLLLPEDEPQGPSIAKILNLF